MKKSTASQRESESISGHRATDRVSDTSESLTLTKANLGGVREKGWVTKEQSPREVTLRKSISNLANPKILMSTQDSTRQGKAILPTT